MMQRHLNQTATAHHNRFAKDLRLGTKRTCESTRVEITFAAAAEVEGLVFTQQSKYDAHCRYGAKLLCHTCTNETLESDGKIDPLIYNTSTAT